MKNLLNKPNLFSAPTLLPKIASSDHYTISIVAKNNPPTGTANAKQNDPAFRRVLTESNFHRFGQWITTVDWSTVLELEACEDKYLEFHKLISGTVDVCFPFKRVKTLACDKPWLTCKLKFLIGKRQSALAKFGCVSEEFKFWRNRVKNEIKVSKAKYYSSSVQHLRDSNISHWWRHVKKLSTPCRKSEWYHQFINEETPSLDNLCQKINNAFVNISSNFSPLDHCPNSPSIHVPDELLVSSNEVFCDLSRIKTRSAIGPDGIPNRVLKDFAFELAPVLADVYNSSMKQGVFPEQLKASIAIPLPA